MKHVKFNLVLILLLLVSSNIIYAFSWETNFQRAVQKAKSENKLIFAYFYTPVADECKTVENLLFIQPQTKKRMNQFVCVKLNAMNQLDLAKYCGVFRVPTVSILTAEKKVQEVFSGKKKISKMGSKLDDLINANKGQSLQAYQQQQIQRRKVEREQNKEGKIKVNFKYYNPNTDSVSVVGDFNDWDVSADRLERVGEFWKLTSYINKGRYEYKYYADGQYYDDPLNKLSANNEYGGKNSVLFVGVRQANSPVITRNIVTFNYYNIRAKQVQLAGDFTDWATSARKMHKKANGLWTISLKFPKGRFQYKFVVDGDNWITDPLNKQTAADKDGISNSIVTVR